MNLRRALALGALALPSIALLHCERDAFIGRDFPAGAGAGGTNAGGAPGSGGGAATGGQAEAGAPASCVPISCQDKMYACGNCKDDDDDGRIDSEDPDCLGPCQESEESFASPSHGNGPPCELDCYFDGNVGSGDDGCGWSHRCDPLSVEPEFPPEGAACAFDENASVPRTVTCAAARAAQSPKCAETCLSLTPNGCDCFGCCTFPGLDYAIWLGSARDEKTPCDLAHATDTSVCKPCTQVRSCLNRCDDCELCVGKTELPASCNAGVECPTPVCARNNPCGSPCLPTCPEGQACITGCCAEIPR
jgi:hypothetical protein